MKTYSKLLLTATSAVGLISSSGVNAAAVPYNAAEIHGNGASSIINLINKSFQCLGNPDAPIGFGGDGSTQTFPSAVYSPVTPTTTNPVYHCDTQSIQSQLQFHYVSTGSGGGKKSWSNFNQSGITTLPSSFTSAYSDGHIQYALSDSSISSTDLANYNNTSVSTSPISNGAGPAIMIPFYVLPVALTYAPTYGKIMTGGVVHSLSLNVKSTYVQHAPDGTTVTGGLRLSKDAYCKIANGIITNWNDPELKTLNGGQSLMDPADDATAWSTTGVPIVLVGRQDKSGTTNAFTRALTAQCGAVSGNAFTAGGQDSLVGGYPSRVGSAVYSESDGSLTSGAETAGLFGQVTGSDGIAAVVGRTLADPTSNGQRVLGGYLGYVGADLVLPASLGTASPHNYSAALQIGTGTTYAMPTATNASASFGTNFLPPESNTNGTYNPTTPAAGSVGHRNNPLDWVLPTNATTGLANPPKGYPVVATTNLLLYTCYNSAAKREAVVAMAGLQFGKLAQSSDGSHFPVGLVNSTAKGSDGLPLGIIAHNGLANLPSAWVTAIWETFFTKVTSGNNPSSLNLWIQDKLPTTAATVNTVQSNSAVCTAGQGA